MNGIVRILILCLTICTSNEFLSSQEIQRENGNIYEFVKKPATWTIAKSKCESSSTMIDQLIVPGHLVTIQSEEELEFILDLIPANIRTIWIGGSDQEKDGNWEWVGGEAFEFTNWDSGEPNGGKSENCLELYARDHDRPGYWNDNKCDSDVWLSYICEYSKPQ